MYLFVVCSRLYCVLCATHRTPFHYVRTVALRNAAIFDCAIDKETDRMNEIRNRSKIRKFEIE